MARVWSSEDDETLQRLYGTIPNAELARQLDRSVAAVNSRAINRGIAGPSRRWTREEDTILRLSYGSVSLHELATRLNRTPSAVHSRVNRLGISAGCAPQHREDVLLRELYPIWDLDEIAERVGLSREAVSKRVRKLDREALLAEIVFKALTPKGATCRDLARRIGVSEFRIRGAIRRLTDTGRVTETCLYSLPLQLESTRDLSPLAVRALQLVRSSGPLDIATMQAAWRQIGTKRLTRVLDELATAGLIVESDGLWRIHTQRNNGM